MAVKILHAADFHMDSPFDALPADKAMRRRSEQRDMLEAIARLASQEQTQLVLLSGDLFDSGLSYFETYETLIRVLSRIEAYVFIAPGNHDYYCAGSPYATQEFPNNVHIFKSGRPEYVEIPELNCRVWGSAFLSEVSPPMLTGFTAPQSDRTEIMVLHGDVGGRVYNPITPEDIENSGLDYLALGHVHSHGGIQRAGRTAYAYPGCPEGRGFDECGVKGVIMGTVAKGGSELAFTPLNGREYSILNVDLTGQSDVYNTVRKAMPVGRIRDIVRVVLTGQYGGTVDTERIESLLEGVFFHASVRNETRPPREMWDGCEEDTLRGILLRSMRKRYEMADEDEKRLIAAAVKCAAAALDNREEWRS